MRKATPSLSSEAGSLARTKDTRSRDVEDQLDPGVGGIGMLPARTAAGAETPFQLGGWDDQVTAADPKAVCRGEATLLRKLARSAFS